MAPRNSKNRKRSTKKTQKHSFEFLFIILIAVGILLAASMYTQQAGIIGRGIRNIFIGFFGLSAYVIPFVIIGFSGIGILKKSECKWNAYCTKSLLYLIYISTAAQTYTYFQKDSAAQLKYNLDTMITAYHTDTLIHGGVLGCAVGLIIFKLLGKFGSIILYMTITALWLMKRFNISYGQLIHILWEGFYLCVRSIIGWVKDQYITKKEKAASSIKIEGIKENIKEDCKETSKENVIERPKETALKPDIQIIDSSKRMPVEKEQQQIASDPSFDEIMSQNGSGETVQYEYPSIELLNFISSTDNTKDHKKAILENAQKLQEVLKSFGVEATVGQVSKGPTVTRYELQPGVGVKVSKIAGLADDIALNLAASGIRIEAPIPGKAAVGIEVPNKDVVMVGLREVIDSMEFSQFESKLAFGLGKDISGSIMVADIAKMPHLLIAGSTGSGKSVCINTLITSIIYKANPNEVKLILVDPKVVELSIYNGIPHLMIPVVTDPKKASNALHWAVREMEKRYQLFSQNNVRDLKGYNRSVVEKGEPDVLPQIVIVIDELADLMMVAPGEVEDAICRLAQMARAAGIHLVIATQRPSVDVITGIIKANIPSRIAFAVSSQVDSRTILDMAGAEKLLGKGDMLFYPIGAAKPIRVQGAFISDKEVENIVNIIKKPTAVEYNHNMITEIEQSPVNQQTEEFDEILPIAVDLIMEKEKASISMLQRAFKIGYNRAARIVDEMERMGIISGEEGSKPRRILLSLDEYERLKEKWNQFEHSKQA